MQLKHTRLILIVAISIAALLTLLSYNQFLSLPFVLLELSWAVLVVALILHLKKKFLWVIAGLVLLIAVLTFSLQYKSVQTYIAHKAAKYLSDELKTRIEISSLYIKPFKSLVLEGLYVQDLEGDTLLSTPKFTLDLNMLSFELRKISVQSAQMDNGKFYIKQYKDSATNVQFIVNYFNTGKPNPVKKVRKPYDITFDKIVLNNIAFKYTNFNTDLSPRTTINFNDLALWNLHTTILNLDTRTHLAKADIKNLTFREKSGFYLKNLSSQAIIDTNRMEFKNLRLETPNTLLSDYLLMSFNDFKDFPQFLTKVYVKTHLANSHIDSRDIAFFTSRVKPVTMDMELDGDLSGYLNNIKARDFTIKTGKSTYISGNFDIKGLPKTSETFLSLKFDRVATNKQDADYIIKTFTGKENLIPDVVNKFGNINFQGHFTGFLKDFIAHGEFNTALGRVVSDINMKINGSNPVYTGTIRTYDFNIGELLNRKDISRISMTTSVKGSGFSLKSLNESFNANIAYIDYNGYRYNNVKADGSFKDKLFDGIINVDDENIKLDFKGTVNLKTATPEFNFTAALKSTNLHALKLAKDTARIDADIKANFSGTTVDNIQGNFELRNIHLKNAKDSLFIDSLLLAAEGIGDSRSLTINSNILDASIKGQYDLKTLPDYFLSVLKKYIPSLDVKVAASGTQNFDLKLKLKDFEPFRVLFIPDLKIPEGATINGKFVTAENLTTVNAFARHVQYKNIKVANLILDESNTVKDLNVFVTADTVSFSNDTSLYVKNVNISNIIRNDSLALNIKLSDKNATNQLDLNGLVEFARDSTFRLSVLPSDVVINREAWKIQDKVHLKYDDKKVFVENFELFRDNQLLTVNGIISNDPKDEIKLGFNKFKLASFNALTKGRGLTMKGELNGTANIWSVLSTSPRIEAEIGVDSMTFNNTLLGDLKLNAGYDYSTKLVNVKMKLLKNGEETLNVAGTYNANAEQNTLDMVGTMRNTDVVIFQPLLKNLVSNLRGTVSAEHLTVKGKLTKAQINGKLALNNVGMTINYLKTPYTITDTSIVVTNNIIKFDNLVIRDNQDHVARATGTVDLINPNIPDVQLDIKADNFMVLNTTEKDNSLYYGTAYGSGDFGFHGPTNDMLIDIYATTAPGTVFNIPLNSTEIIRDNDFITFLSRDTTLNKRKQTSFKGLRMNFHLNITQDAELNLYTDLGKLSGNGTAEDLQLQITSAGEFNMFGDYLVSKGKFIYNPNNYISRAFNINQGGTIHWRGDPTEATINLTTTYSNRVSTLKLMQAAGRPTTGAQRVPVDVVMSLNGRILNPDISFDISFPENAAIRDEVQYYLADKDNRILQAVSLIVRRDFAPGGSGEQKITDLGGQIVLNAGTELAFTQFNNLVSQALNSSFLELNIRSFNELSATVRLLNNRLILTGGVTDKLDTRETQLINLVGATSDVEAQYLIRKDGSLILQASNKPDNGSFLNRVTSDKNENVSAFGLIFRQEFDSFKEFLHIIFGRGRREQLEKEKEQPPTLSPPVASKSAPADPVSNSN